MSVKTQTDLWVADCDGVSPTTAVSSADPTLAPPHAPPPTLITVRDLRAGELGSSSQSVSSAEESSDIS